MLVRIVFLLSTLSLLALVHITALEFFLYWKYLWLDIPMHILGGICIAFGISVLPFFRITVPPRFQTLSGYASMALLVGVFWEIFEVAIGIPFTEEGFIFDVILDLCMGVLGAIIGYGIVKSIQKI